MGEGDPPEGSSPVPRAAPVEEDGGAYYLGGVAALVGFRAGRGRTSGGALYYPRRPSLGLLALEATGRTAPPPHHFNTAELS